MIGETEHEKLAAMLLEKKFFGGWTLEGTELVLWEHDYSICARERRTAGH